MVKRERIRGAMLIAALAAGMFGWAAQTQACDKCGHNRPAPPPPVRMPAPCGTPCAAPCDQVRLIPGYFICETQRVCIAPGYWRTFSTPPVTSVCYDICGRPYTTIIAPPTCSREWIPPSYEDRVIRKWVAPRWERIPAPPMPPPMPCAPRVLPPPPQPCNPCSGAPYIHGPGPAPVSLQRHEYQQPLPAEPAQPSSTFPLAPGMYPPAVMTTTYAN